MSLSFKKYFRHIKIARLLSSFSKLSTHLDPFSLLWDRVLLSLLYEPFSTFPLIPQTGATDGLSLLEVSRSLSLALLPFIFLVFIAVGHPLFVSSSLFFRGTPAV